MPTKSAPKPPKTLDEVHEGRTNIFRIPSKHVRPALLSDGSRLNVRDDFGTDEERDAFALSIAEHGIRQPLLGTWKDGFFYYDDGDRRMDGHKIAVEKYGLKGEKALIPIRRQEKGTSDEQRSRDLLTLNSGKNLNMYEEARVMLRLSTVFSNTPEQIAAAKGCSSTHVKNCLDLLTESSEEVIAMVSAGRLAATTAADFVHEVPSKERQVELLAEAQRAAGAAESHKITARHFSIPLGKKAQESRRETPVASVPSAASVPSVGAPAASTEGRPETGTKNQETSLPPEPRIYQSWLSLDNHHQSLVFLAYDENSSELAMFEFAFENDECVDRRQLLSTAAGASYPEPGAATATDPFAGKDSEPTSAQVDDNGVFISGIVNRPIQFTAPGVSGSIGLASRNSEWFMGIIIKWPGQSKEDGFLRVPPSLKGKAYERNQLAEIDGVLRLRAELESKSFTARFTALADIDRHLQSLIRGLSPDDAKLYQAAQIKPVEDPKPESKAAAPGISNPVIPPGMDGATLADAQLLLAVKQLISEIPAADAEKDRLQTVKNLHAWLAGKVLKTELAKYLLGVIDKVEPIKKAA